MRVLLAGNYDIAGQYIAMRLFKEGHNIIWLTGEPEKELWETSVKGKVYRFGLSYKSCSQIIKTESPDAVIALTQRYRDSYDWYLGESAEAEEGFADLLRAAASLNVKKIIYLSSKEINGDTLLNPAFETLRAGERLCQSVCAAGNMDCLILRSGIIYGKGKYAESSFLSRTIRTMYEGKKIRTDFSSFSAFDFTYAPDFADALDRLLALGETGIHTVASGSHVALKELHDAVAEQIEYKTEKIKYGSREHTEDAADGLEFKRCTGWIPFYVPEKLLPEVIAHYKELLAQDNVKKEKKKYQNDFLRNLMENLALFALIMLLNLGSSDWSDLRFVDVKLLYVMIVAITFGMRQGVIAMILASAAYLVKLSLAEIDLSYIMYSMETWIPFMVYAVAGALMGYVADKKKDDWENMEESHESLKDKYSFLKSMYQEVLNIKNQLQKQIMTSKDSLGHIYEITEELETTRPRTVMIRTVKVVEETMECSSVAIYVRANQYSSYGRLMACSGNIAKTTGASINFAEYKELDDVIKQKEMYVNTALHPDYPSFAMPVCDEDKIVAVVMIYDLDPNKFTEYYKNLFKTLVLIMRSSLIRAYNYQENNKEKNYIPGTSILVSEEFSAELETITRASEELNIPFSKGRVFYPSEWSYEELEAKLSKAVRGTDILGCDEEGNVFVILMFVLSSARLFAEKRFLEAGMSVEWEG